MGLPAGPDRGDFGPGGEEAVDVVDVHRVAPGALQRGGPADLPVPAHRVTGAVQVRRGPALALAPGLTGQWRGGRVDLPAEGDLGRAGPAGGAHRHPVRPGQQRAGVEHAVLRQGAPRARVDPVPLGHAAVGRVGVRRGHLEILLGRSGLALRGPVDERRGRCPVPRVGAGRGGEHADRAADDLEGERVALGLDDLGGGLGQPEAAPGVRVADGVAAGGERRGRAVRPGPAVRPGRVAALPGVGDREAEQAHAARQPGRVPAQPGGGDRRAVPGDARDAQRAVVHGRRDSGGPGRGARDPGGERGEREHHGGGQGQPRLHGQLRKAGGSRSRWAAKRSSHMATVCAVVSVAAVFGSSRAAW